VKPAHAAVDCAKQKKLTMAARELLRHVTQPCSGRLDFVPVYCDDHRYSTFGLFQNAFSVAYNHEALNASTERI
jgi:hypothetical protein